MPNRRYAGTFLPFPHAKVLSAHTRHKVWDGVSDARINFNSIEMGLGRATGNPQMARLTENLNLQRALLRHIGGNPATQLFDKIKVHSISREELDSGGWPLVHLSDGRVLRARLLVSSRLLHLMCGKHIFSNQLEFLIWGS